MGAAKTMIERTEERVGLRPERLAADTAYGSADNLNWLVNEKQIAPHIPVIDKSNRNDGTLSRDDFTFDNDRNVYVCPKRKLLTTIGAVAPSRKTHLQRWALQQKLPLACAELLRRTVPTQNRMWQ